jgi:pimeloyl-ACP methyl ester carboxylesterase
MRNAWAGLALISSAFLGACGVAVPRADFEHYAMTVNGDGNILAPKSDAPKRTFSEISPDGFSSYVDDLFKAVEKKDPPRVMLFVHGGLNSLSNSTERVGDLIRKYDSGELPFYPIFINWDSGLWESLGDHLVRVRQGEKAEVGGSASAIFYVLADLGRTVFRAPITIGYTAHNDASAFPGSRVTGEEKTYSTQERENPRLIYKCLVQQGADGNISLGREYDWDLASGRLYAKSFWNTATFAFQYLTAPPIDGFGAPAWEMMQRRAKVLFNKPEQFDIEKETANVAGALQGRPTGAMTVFMRRLEQYLKPRRGKVEVAVVAHSMGTFIANEMLRAYPDLDYRDIVYMAGADSIRNTFNSVLPYLDKPAHRSTTFYNLTLHPQAEVEEMSGFGFLPRGSLLIWVDNFFSTPNTHYDRTVGRWDNLLPALGEVPEKLKPQIKIKAFDQSSAVSTHGDFTKQEFWRSEFWEPGKRDCDPWPAEKGSACPAPTPMPPVNCSGPAPITAASALAR